MIYSIKLTHEFTVGKALQNGGKCEYDPDAYFNCSKCKNDQSNVKNNENENQTNNKNTEKTEENLSKPSHICDKTAGDYSYIPFGKGQRMCAGKNYGMLFLRIMLFELVRTTNFKLNGKLKFSAVPMTKPHKSVVVEFEKMKQQ